MIFFSLILQAQCSLGQAKAYELISKTENVIIEYTLTANGAKKYTVENKKQLLSAITSSKNGDVIYIDDNAQIDLTGENSIKIPGGVCIESGRGKKESIGALLFTNQLKTTLFFIEGDNVKISGLRIGGPDSSRNTEQLKLLLSEGGKKAYYSIPFSRGIESSFSNTIVTNCELWGWSHASIFFNGTTKSKSVNNHVYHNYIHHNQRSGLGYGIALNNAEALIEYNTFDWNRHAIAGTGRSETSYEARYNTVLPNANGHAFDMHGGKDRKDSTDIAGKKISIHHNKFFLLNYPAIAIRGKPIEACIITSNEFAHDSQNKAIKQRNGIGNMQIGENKYNLQSEVNNKKTILNDK